jgi:hypothetical protein
MSFLAYATLGSGLTDGRKEVNVPNGARSVRNEKPQVLKNR